MAAMSIAYQDLSRRSTTLPTSWASRCSSKPPPRISFIAFLDIAALSSFVGRPATWGVELFTAALAACLDLEHTVDFASLDVFEATTAACHPHRDMALILDFNVLDTESCTADDLATYIHAQCAAARFPRWASSPMLWISWPKQWQCPRRAFLSCS
ncbi:hypothetical protein MKEN_00757100 [Mycena kentingensis (nom. inval.)]|nr:hypothetical protein MKEN_00757100 [Mycena kentingensis (nom. inval.)]